MAEMIGALCFGETEATLFDIKNVPELILYSHLPAAIIATLLAVFLLIKGWRKLPNVILSLALLFFAYWVYANVLIWGTNRSDIIMFHWSLQVLFEPLVYIGMFYLFWLYTAPGKELSLKVGALIGALYLPLVIATPTSYSLAGFNLAECIPDEGFFSYAYTYVLETLSILGIIVYMVRRYRSSVDPVKKKEMLYLGIGTLSFLLPFAFGNIFGSYTGEWVKSQFGLFGMPVFAGFLTYLIVRFQAFDIRLLSVQALVAVLVMLVGSQLFFIKSQVNFILTAITATLVCGVGYVLIRSVRKEIKRKEELQEMATKLALANENLHKLDTAKSEFISIASHQLRTPLTAIKGYVSLLLEGSYGELSHSVQDVLGKVYIVNSRLTQLVEDLLSVSRIEAGRVQYHYEETELGVLIRELVDTFQFVAKKKNLTLTLNLPAQPMQKLIIDPNKIKEVISNIIDNALKYTQEGGVTVTVEPRELVVRIIVSDTGIGVAPEDMKKLFHKFVRSAATSKLDVSGTGLGLYVGKSFVEAHGGSIKVESDGVGRGSRFIIAVPWRAVQTTEQTTFRREEADV